ncbi:hypothetical protein HDF16_001962 [Granulicella aggregans]|uniref:Parallel beta helix pectate lyase-like protein n=1 Tax=Granulicella aggregans TaxID=474949 RepID=A0A7W7ZCG5_9BACT|nr:hypothetical protein [Granulicella aggregans]MBB5057277.1 hypothetical protein [Granulicella aggregans]
MNVCLDVLRLWLSKLFLPFAGLNLLLLSGCGSGVHCYNPPTITNQSLDESVDSGSPAIFTVAAIGTGVLSYQWQKNGVPITGATQPGYTIPATVLSDSGSSFNVVISSALGTARSLPAKLNVVHVQAPQTSFVAMTGSDSSPGTIDQPYKTIQHCAETMTAGGSCEIRAGVYYETVKPNDAITITAYQLEVVTIDGSDPVKGWTLDHGAIYKSTVTLNADDTNQLFVGADMMTEARWPNGDDLFNVNWAKAGDGTGSTEIVDSGLPKIDWTGAKVHSWGGTDPFSHQTGVITSSANGRVGIDMGQTGTCPYICPSAGGYYYLYGSLGALDAEREWFYDSSASTLYFMAPGGVNPDSLDVRSKVRPYAFDLRGKTEITVSNIRLFASSIVMDEHSSKNTIDRMTVTYPSHFTSLPVAADDPNGSNFSFLQVHEADTGIILDGTDNMLANSIVSFSAGAGIAVEGTGNTIVNNLIQNVGYVGNYASGIDLDGENNSILYNTVSNSGRHALIVSGDQNEDIGFNNFFNGMLLSRDGAEIYACCRQQASGTRIHHNWIHDTKAIISGQGDSIAMTGIGFDNGSGGFRADQNILWDNHVYNILVNGASTSSPNNNQIANNSVPDSSSEGRLAIIYVESCASTKVADNKLVVKIELNSNKTACNVVNNGPHSAGATEMSSSTRVGCNFMGCSSNRPPVILDGGSVTGCPVSGTN